ncbi:MAG: hypothetical protein HC849_33975, partial [Oscillatoriales cyanobacterium RU_3_3]|nr:hypothetical protein [Oscillatoriales cyanobacterium RU_3_3]
MSEFTQGLDKMLPAEQTHCLEILPSQLAATSDVERLYSLLIDYNFIESKLAAAGVQKLIEDYDLATNSEVLACDGKADTLKLIQETIRLSAHILAKDKTQLAAQLIARLMCFQTPEIKALIAQAQHQKTRWLRPLTPSFTPPGGKLLRTLTGHTDWVQAVAITPDGKRAISASSDHTLKVWQLETGEEICTLKGHLTYVNAVAVTPDGTKVISGSWDNTIKIWNLATGTEIFTFAGDTFAVEAVTVTPDGKRVISGSWD